MALTLNDYKQYQQELARRGSTPPFIIDDAKGTVTLLDKAAGKPSPDSTVVHFDAKGQATSLEMGISHNHKTMPMTERISTALKTYVGCTESDVIGRMAKGMTGNQHFEKDHHDPSARVVRDNPKRFNEAVDAIVSEEGKFQQRSGKTWVAENSAPPTSTKPQQPASNTPPTTTAQTPSQVAQTTPASTAKFEPFGLDGNGHVMKENGTTVLGMKQVGDNKISVTLVDPKSPTAVKAYQAAAAAAGVDISSGRTTFSAKEIPLATVLDAAKSTTAPHVAPAQHTASTPDAPHQPHVETTGIAGKLKSAAPKFLTAAAAIAAAGTVAAKAPDGQRMNAAITAGSETMLPNSTSADFCDKVGAVTGGVAGSVLAVPAGAAGLGGGAAAGSAVPVVGTIVGGAVGAVGMGSLGFETGYQTGNVVGKSACNAARNAYDNLSAQAKAMVANIQQSTGQQTSLASNAAHNSVVAKPAPAQGAARS